MADLLALSSHMIDNNVRSEPPNRVTQELSEIGDGIAIIESFSHVVLLKTDEGLVAFDTSNHQTAERVVGSLRNWSNDPVHTLVYTHGHLDHVGGSFAFIADAERRGDPRPRVFGHEAIAHRFDRYRATSGYNTAINARQFGWQRNSDVGLSQQAEFLPTDVADVDTSFSTKHVESIGGVQLEYNHGLGETDDHTWTWIPEKKALSVGDFLIWNFPNAGNPQKVQRFPAEWAATMRAMAEKNAELLLPAHGLPIAGTERIRTVLVEVAEALEFLVSETVAMMNNGARLDEIIHSVKIPESTLARPFLTPLYDEPEFILHNIWRLYGGWWDGNPATLKPAPDAAVAAAVAGLAGGALTVATRANEAAAAGDLRLAGHLIEFATQAEPENGAVHEIRAHIYKLRRAAESSLMAKGIFASAERDSVQKLGQTPEHFRQQLP